MLLYTKHIRCSDGGQVGLSYKGVQHSNYVARVIFKKMRQETLNAKSCLYLITMVYFLRIFKGFVGYKLIFITIFERRTCIRVI